MTRIARLKKRTPLLMSCVLLALSTSPAYAAAPAASEAPALVPLPASMQLEKGTFPLSASTALYAQGDDASTVARQFAAIVARDNGITLDVKADDKARNGIRFVIDDSITTTSKEAYVLEATPKAITVKARDAAGLFYGAVTLTQLIQQGKKGLSIPATRIEDGPRFSWRGLMLDSARHFQSMDEIKKLLDAMAEQKMNTFHWHLTDDQGWRMEIKRYPKLTEVGSCRIPAGDGGIDPVTGKPKPYCGFYTQDQIREIIAYAGARHIQVIPEVDVPGHATAAIAAYPELGVTDKKLVPLSEWGVFPNLFNVEDSTAVFLENVLEEVIELFPAKYVHVGGDEAVKDQWIASKRVQQRMRELGLKDEMEMQSHLIKRLEKFLEQHDRRLIGWDEILEGGLPPEATVMSWRGTEGGLKAASEGHDVVMSPVTTMYMDYQQTTSPNEPPGRPLQIPLEKVYDYEPVPAELAADKRSHILGLQANMFNEHTRSDARLEHNLFPRLAAVAETGWSPQASRNYASFLKRLPTQLQRYQAMGIHYAQTPFQVMADNDGNRQTGAVTTTLSNPLGYDIHYTTDGSAVTAQSPKYSQPLQATLPIDVKAAAFFNGKPLASAASEFKLDVAGLLTRNHEQLGMCPEGGKLLLRLEDDGPLEGERAIFNVNIFNPCWLWEKADLTGISSVRVRAGQIPYYFQLAHDEPARTFVPARSAHGEMELLAGCKGPVLATVPLPAKPDADGFITLEAPLAAHANTQDLCLRFTGDTRPTMWVLDRITLIPH